MNVILLRTNKVDPDPRVEKEVDALLQCKNINIKVVAWDRTEKYFSRVEILNLPSGSTKIIRFGIPALWGGGMRKNLIPFIIFNFRLFFWMMNNHNKYDCVHACDLGTALPALIPILVFKKKFIYDIYDYYADTKQNKNFLMNIIKWIENKIIGIADITIICSEKRKEQIKYSNPKKLIIIHNSPDKNQIKDFDNIKERICVSNTSMPKIVYIGNLVKDRFIKQLLYVVSELKNVELHIGGYGVLEEYVKIKSKKEQNIYFYGKLQYNKVLKLESECDIIIALYDPKIPNHKYAAPNKFYEALLLGKPIIMFHNTGVDDIIDKNDIGITIESNTESLKQGIENLIKRKNEWPIMNNKLKFLYYNYYSWDIMKDRIISIYTDLQKIYKE